jgi:hypothetical protein
MRWLEQRIVERHRPTDQVFRHGGLLRLRAPRIRSQWFALVGVLRRYPVYSQVCARRVRQDTLKTEIRARLRWTRRVLPLPP